MGVALSVGLLPVVTEQGSAEVSGPSQVSAVLDGPEWLSALDGASDIEVFGSEGRMYAVLAVNNKVSVRDITDPAHPDYVWGVSDDTGRFIALDGAADLEVFESGGRMYIAVAAEDDDGVQFIDVTDPASPAPVSAVFGGSGGFTALDGAADLEVFESGGRMYAAVAAVYDGGAVQFIDVTDPASPAPVSAVFDGSGGFGALDGVYEVEVFESGGRMYAAVAAAYDHIVQIADITDPASPAPVSAVFDGSGGFTALDGAADLEVFESGGRMYAAVAAADDDGVQFIDVTDPASPAPVSAVFDGSGGFINGLDGYWNQVVTELFSGLGGFVALDGANNLEVFESKGRTYAMVTAWNDGGVQIIDVTDPASPTPVSAVFDGPSGFIALDWAVDVEVFGNGGHTYAIVVSGLEGAVQIMDITDPARPVYDGSGRFASLATNDLEVFGSGGRTYAIVVAYYEDDTRIMDITDPAHPVSVYAASNDPESPSLWIER